MSNSPPSLPAREGAFSRRLVSVTLIAFTLAVYLFPILKTWKKTGSGDPPPILSSDIGLYLLLSKLRTLSDGAVLNPYYGIEVPAHASSHLKFRLAFRLFGYLDSPFGNHLAAALLTWNLLWWLFLSLITFWLFAKFLPDKSPLPVAVGFGFMMWINFGVINSIVRAWMHIPSLAGFDNLSLPFVRPFFPELPVPLLLAYIGLQIIALRKPGPSTWIGMAILQALVFAIFPYTSLMMAGVTFFSIVWMVFAPGRKAPWATILTYGAVCAAFDLIYLHHVRTIALVASPAQLPPPSTPVDLALLPHLIGGIWIVIALLTAAVILVREIPPEVKWPLAGLGLTNLALLLGDVYFSELALMMSHHAAYFVHPTVALLLAFLLSAACVRFSRRLRSSKYALASLLIFLAANAVLLANATYRSFLPLNQQQVESMTLLKSLALQADDLLIVHAGIVDDTCEWVPLESTATVLYCRNAAVLLSPEQNIPDQRLRQALYLYFTGMDSRRMQSIADDPNAATEQMRYAFYGGLSPARKEEREAGLSMLRHELIPLLDRVAGDDPSARAMLRQHPRILVLDDSKSGPIPPIFDRQRLNQYLTVQNEARRGDQTVLICTPK